MSYSREQWARVLLAKIGNVNPGIGTVEWVVAWTFFETDNSNGPHAAYNLLNTTEPNTPGVVSDFNSVGVKNYDTFDHGVMANAKVLQNGRYPVLCQDLRSNSLTINHETQYNQELSVWGTGPKFKEIFAQMGQHMSDLFPGNTGGTSLPTPSDDAARIEFNCVIKGTWWNSGIQQSWLAAYHAGHFFGPALTPETPVGDDIYQWFASGLCIWNRVTGLPSWRKNT